MNPETPAPHCQSDPLDPARAMALQVVLGRAPTIVKGMPLPPFFHQIYFWSPEPAEDLGRDGHPRVGVGLIPDLGLGRRMWAGGRLQFRAPLIAGQVARKSSIVEKVTRKQGRSGRLGFVTLRHDIRQGDTLCVREWQDIVYRQDADDLAPVVPTARQDESDAHEISFNPTLLFRYSALTLNGHRIHYDQDYARDVEGYRGLVVHGPLLAQMLMLMALDLMGPLTGFEFRATSPLVHTQTAWACRKGDELWVRGGDGRLVMRARADPGAESASK